MANKKMRAVKKCKRVGTIVFYSVFAGLIAVFAIGVGIGLHWLENWLIQFEASQPTVKNSEVFAELFKNPDWEKIYRLAGEKDTPYEDSAAYAAYMQQKVGDESLNYLETSAGLSGDKKYIVRLGTEKIATYTLTNTATEDATLAQWELGTVEIFYTRSQSVTVEVLPGYTVYVNGVALDDSYTIRTTETVAEKYLPEGIHGYRTLVQYVDGFLVQPEVVVRDAAGNAAELTYDAQTGIYTQSVAYDTLPDTVKSTLIGAAQTFGKYMIEAVGSSSLRVYFDSQTQLYKDIISVERWAQRHIAYDFTAAEISDYFRYSDTLCSAKIKMTMLVTRTNGTVKEYPLDTTYFLEQKEDGKWQVINLTNVDAQEKVTMVRLQYLLDGVEVYTEMVNSTTSSVTLPQITIPAGKKFLGWFAKTVDDSGKTTMTLVFAPSEENVVHLPEGTVLGNMTLYAQFQ